MEGHPKTGMTAKKCVSLTQRGALRALPLKPCLPIAGVRFPAAHANPEIRGPSGGGGELPIPILRKVSLSGHLPHLTVLSWPASPQERSDALRDCGSAVKIATI